MVDGSGTGQLSVLWKSRLPAIAVPILATLRQVSHEHDGVSVVSPGLYPAGEVALLLTIAWSTGYLHLPFSVTWWLVLLCALALKTEVLMGVAVALSLSVLVGWYGSRLMHPQIISALWGGSGCGNPLAPTSSWQVGCWHAWDLVVHFSPALLMVYSHGPYFVFSDGVTHTGVVTPMAMAVALPLNIVWLWGLSSKRGACAMLPWTIKYSDANIVYRVEPLPVHAWQWVFSSHWCVCGVWLCFLVLPVAVTGVGLLFTLLGVFGQPYTLGWWMIFLAAVIAQGTCPLLEGMVCVSGATTACGFYGAQICAPWAFKSLVQTWLVRPVCRHAPSVISSRLQQATEMEAFYTCLRFADLFLHAIPTMTAVSLKLTLINPTF